MDAQRVSRFARAIERTFGRLGPRERRLLELRFGLNDGRAHDLTELAGGMTSDASVVRATVASALAALRPAQDEIDMAITLELGRETVDRPDVAHAALSDSLTGVEMTARHPDRWMIMLAYAFPAIPVLATGGTRGLRISEIAASMLDVLTPRERRVLASRFGLQDGQRRTLQRIGSIEQISRERVRQVERKAIEKIHVRLQSRVETALEVARLREGRSSLAVGWEYVFEQLKHSSPSNLQPDAWMAFLAKMFPQVSAFAALPDVMPFAWGVFSRIQAASAHSVVYRDDFARAIEHQSTVEEDPSALWNALHESDSRLIWVDDAAIPDRYAPLAYYVLRESQVPMHWSDIHARADEITEHRELPAGSFYNAIGNSAAFVRTAGGTYGLDEWGIAAAPYQKDVIADIIADRGWTMSKQDVIAAVRERGHDMAMHQ